MFLTKEFGRLVNELLANCRNRGITMIPYQGLRSPYVQAKYWKQARSQEEIKKVLRQLEENDALFLCHCLQTVTSVSGRLVTHAIPGCSWHQWGEAVDCYWMNEECKSWDTLHYNASGLNGYSVYAEEAQKLGLTSGLYWSDLVDAVHVQLRPETSPLALYSLKEIDEIMKDTFSRAVT